MDWKEPTIRIIVVFPCLVQQALSRLWTGIKNGMRMKAFLVRKLSRHDERPYILNIFHLTWALYENDICSAYLIVSDSIFHSIPKSRKRMLK